MFFSMSLSPFSVSFFLKEEFNVIGIFLGLNILINLARGSIFKESENNFVMCCQTLGQTSLIFFIYNPVIFLPNQLNNKEIISRIRMVIANLPFVIILILS